jgi:geranylgeranyl diphosphate synthase type II
MDDYGSIAFTREYAEGILLVAEEYFEQAFADAPPGPRLPPCPGPLRVGAVAVNW